MSLPSVLIVCTYFPPLNRTGARRPYYLARALREAGHRVAVLTSQEDNDAEWHADLRGIEVMRCARTHLQRNMRPWQQRFARLHHRLRGSPVHGPLRLLADCLLPEEHAQRWDVLPDEVAARLGRYDVVLATVPGWGPARTAFELAAAWRSTFLLDYRDPWSIADPSVHMDVVSGHGTGLSGAVRRAVFKTRERKLGQAAYAITAVSKAFLENARSITGNPRGKVFRSGFDPAIKPVVPVANDKFTLSYTGRLYPEQDWGLVFDALGQLASDLPDLGKLFRLRIVGAVSTDKALMEQLGLAAERWDFVELTRRVPREEAVHLQYSADALLHLTYRGRKGYLPVKFLEYIGSGKPLVLVTAEQDVMESVLADTHTGTMVHDAATMARLLHQRIVEHSQGATWSIQPDQAALARYRYPDCLLPWVEQITAWHLERARAQSPNDVAIPYAS